MSCASQTGLNEWPIATVWNAVVDCYGCDGGDDDHCKVNVRAFIDQYGPRVFTVG